MGEFGSIDLNSKKPYYLQVKELIQARIDAGELIPGEKLPSETELCNAMRVSRTVIRQALTELE
ncbi:MAG: winged helix-turn-helix transcriptional regulator, partial [Chloroflexi bacterium]|nr:winged helix-turn-helix transcriptional regulator [Chloroflexota bacterium]